MIKRSLIAAALLLAAAGCERGTWAIEGQAAVTQSDDDESPAPELSGWASRGWIRAQIMNPASGSTYRARPELGPQMPSFAGLLTNEEVELLVDTIRGTFDTQQSLLDGQTQTPHAQLQGG